MQCVGIISNKYQPAVLPPTPSPAIEWEGMGLLEYWPGPPCLTAVTTVLWIHLVINQQQQLELPKSRSWAALAIAGNTAREDSWYGPSITVQITPASHSLEAVLGRHSMALGLCVRIYGGGVGGVKGTGTPGPKNNLLLLLVLGMEEPGEQCTVVFA